MACKQKINVLYTGGLDSSYSMILLSKYDIEIQPYYLKDNRDSQEKELSTIAKIIEDIKNNQNTRCSILPLITMSTADVEKDQQITDAYNRLRETTDIGSQYDWLPRFAKGVNGLCMSLEKSPSSKARKCIARYGDVKFQKEGDFEFYAIDEDKSSSDLVKVFGRFRFPYVLWQKTKLEQAEDFERLGFEDSLSKTWFCFHPVDGGPCGMCNPCISVIEEGMQWRFSKDVLRRYKKQKVRHMIRKMRKYVMGLSNRLLRVRRGQRFTQMIRKR